MEIIYTTREEAIECEIIENLGVWAGDFDLEGIANEVLEETGYGHEYGWKLRDYIDPSEIIKIADHYIAR